jgi:hypothetical protein
MSDFDELNQNLMLIIADVIKHEVADAVKLEESETIKETLYAEFQPMDYQRRKDNGGLSSQVNMQTSAASISGYTATVHVRNVTQGKAWRNNGVQMIDNVQYIIETNQPTENGDYYDYTNKNSPTGKYYLRPRPFQARTVTRLLNNKKHLYAMKRGLEAPRHGIQNVQVL